MKQIEDMVRALKWLKKEKLEIRFDRNKFWNYTVGWLVGITPFFILS